MLVLDQVITQKEIDSFKQFFQDYQSKKYINYQIGDQVIDHRLTIPTDSPLFDIIKRIVASNFSNPIHYWSAYQQQTVPHNIHIDDYGSDQKHLRYTYILAMDSVPEFKAIIWKEKCWDNNALHTFVEVRLQVADALLGHFHGILDFVEGVVHLSRANVEQSFQCVCHKDVAWEVTHRVPGMQICLSLQ
jgi:hypothetical protein